MFLRNAPPHTFLRLRGMSQKYGYTRGLEKQLHFSTWPKIDNLKTRKLLEMKIVLKPPKPKQFPKMVKSEK